MLREITADVWCPERALSVSCAFSSWTRSEAPMTQPVGDRRFCMCYLGLMYILGDVAIPALISTVELSVGILAACLPTYRPFITKLLGRTGDTRAQKPGSYLPVKDSIHIPITNHYSKHGTHTDLDNDDMEMLAGKTGQPTSTHAGNQDWRGPQGNEIRVTTSFKTSST